MSDKHIRTIEVSPIQLETLRAIHNGGPLWDGDVPSKTARDDLLEKGLIEKVVVKSEDGFQACTYRGRAFLRSIQDEIERVRFS